MAAKIYLSLEGLGRMAPVVYPLLVQNYMKDIIGFKEKVWGGGPMSTPCKGRKNRGRQGVEFSVLYHSAIHIFLLSYTNP